MHTLTLNFNTLPELADFMGRLNAHGPIKPPVWTADALLRPALATQSEPEHTPESPDSPTQSMIDSNPKPAGRPRGRPRKDAQAPGTLAAADPAPTPAVDTPAPLVTAASAPANPAPTIDDLRAALQKLNETKGLGACTALLAKYDATRISLLPAGKWIPFVEEARALALGA